MFEESINVNHPAVHLAVMTRVLSFERKQAELRTIVPLPDIVLEMTSDYCGSQ